MEKCQGRRTCSNVAETGQAVIWQRWEIQWKVFCRFGDRAEAGGVGAA